MKILSYNVNGIRAALKKGLLAWIEPYDFDIICLQETKAQVDQLDLEVFAQAGYVYSYWHSAEKKGYSGVAILAKQQPDRVVVGCNIPEYDREGRVLRADFGSLSVMSVYFPSGTSGDERQGVKMRFLTDFQQFMTGVLAERPYVVVAGDYNICHRPIDIHDPVRNKNTTGFLPEEREWMEQWFTTGGFADSFRQCHPQEAHRYTWWSLRFNSRATNKGWRIDYQSISNPLLPYIADADILNEAYHSDHCPTMLDLQNVPT